MYVRVENGAPYESPATNTVATAEIWRVEEHHVWTRQQVRQRQWTGRRRRRRQHLRLPRLPGAQGDIPGGCGDHDECENAEDRRPNAHRPTG